MNIGDTIKLCRGKRRLTQKQLAEKTGLSVSYLSLIEGNHRDPSMASINAIAEALNIPLSIIVLLASTSDDLPDLPEYQIEALSRKVLELMDVAKSQHSIF